MFGIFHEFIDFIGKGNVLDMAIGMVLAEAFNGILAAIVEILLSLCAWSVPGGLKGLITILPAISSPQKGYMDHVKAPNGESLGQKFHKDNLQDVSIALAKYFYDTSEPEVVESVKDSILSMYELYGKNYAYKNSSIIEWGVLLKAILNFFFVGLTLFLMVKFVTWVKKKREKVNQQKKQEKDTAEKEEKVSVEENDKKRQSKVESENVKIQTEAFESEGKDKKYDKCETEEMEILEKNEKLGTYRKEKEREISALIGLIKDISNKLSNIEEKLSRKEEN